MRPVGLPVVDLLEGLRPDRADSIVVSGTLDGSVLVGFPTIWKRIVKGTALENVAPRVLRHSFASMANDLGFTEVTVAALVGHARGTATSRYAVDTAPIMAADTIPGYISVLLHNVEVRRKVYSLDHASREAALAALFVEVVQEPGSDPEQLAA